MIESGPGDGDVRILPASPGQYVVDRIQVRLRDLGSELIYRAYIMYLVRI